MKLSLIFLVLCSIVFWGITGCATLPTHFERTVSSAMTDTEDTSLGRYVLSIKKDGSGKSGFRLLETGLDAFVARAVLAETAERSIDVQYYLYHDDLVGRLFTWQLVKAADRGVRVRILVDDMAMGGRELSADILNSHPNIEVRLFNPFVRNRSRTLQFITRFSSATRRMHSKSFTVDSQMTVLGGRNIGNEYFDADPELAFTDMDVLGVGDVAKDVSKVFDLYWNSELAYPVSVMIKTPPTPEMVREKGEKLGNYIQEQEDSSYLAALLNSDLASQIRSEKVGFKWGTYDVVYDKPEKLLKDKSETEYHLSTMLKPHLQNIKEDLIIFSPYFVPGKKGVAQLAALAEQGVRVRILTNSLASNDVTIVHAGYSKYRKALLRAGVEIYEMNKKFSKEEKKEKKGPDGSSKASLHAKSFVFDRSRIFVGSLNLDPVAVINNTEIGVIIEQEDLAKKMANLFDENIKDLAFRLELIKNRNGNEQLLWHGIENGKEVTYTNEPYTGFWTRFSVGFFRLLPVDSFL